MARANNKSRPASGVLCLRTGLCYWGWPRDGFLQGPSGFQEKAESLWHGFSGIVRRGEFSEPYIADVLITYRACSKVSLQQRFRAYGFKVFGGGLRRREFLKVGKGHRSEAPEICICIRKTHPEVHLAKLMLRPCIWAEGSEAYL